jgi:hypothetical protein
LRTEDFIQSLASEALPVRRLSHPVWRALTWMVGSLLYAALFVWLVGIRPDISDKAADPRFLLEVGAPLLTSLMAAVAAFCAGCPGRPLWERFAPFPFLAVWLATLGEGCWRQAIHAGPEGLEFQPDFLCFQSIFEVSLLPAFVILIMIRQGAPIAPMSTTGLATLAATALGAAALRVFHTVDVSLMLLVWQFGSVALLAAVGFLLGRHWLRWSRGVTSSGAQTKSE